MLQSSGIYLLRGGKISIGYTIRAQNSKRIKKQSDLRKILFVGHRQKAVRQALTKGAIMGRGGDSHTKEA